MLEDASSPLETIEVRCIEEMQLVEAIAVDVPDRFGFWNRAAVKPRCLVNQLGHRAQEARPHAGRSGGLAVDARSAPESEVQHVMDVAIGCGSGNGNSRNACERDRGRDARADGLERSARALSARRCPDIVE